MTDKGGALISIMKLHSPTTEDNRPKNTAKGQKN